MRSFYTHLKCFVEFWDTYLVRAHTHARTHGHMGYNIIDHAFELYIEFYMAILHATLYYLVIIQIMSIAYFSINP